MKTHLWLDGGTIFGAAAGTGQPVRLTGAVAVEVKYVDAIFPTREEADRYTRTGEVPPREKMERARWEWERDFGKLRKD